MDRRKPIFTRSGVLLAVLALALCTGTLNAGNTYLTITNISSSPNTSGAPTTIVCNAANATVAGYQTTFTVAYSGNPATVPTGGVSVQISAVNSFLDGASLAGAPTNTTASLTTAAVVTPTAAQSITAKTGAGSSVTYTINWNSACSGLSQT